MKPGRVLPLLPLLATLACGGGSGPSGPGPGPDDTVGPAGGTVVSADGNATVRVPPGALAGETPIRVTSTSLPASLQAEGGFSPAYRFDPSGQAFAVPVEIEIFVPDGALGGRDPATLRLLTTGGAAGVEPLDGLRRTVVAGGVRLVGTTPHFSSIAPASPPNRPPTVDLGADRTVVVGTAVAVQATTGDPDGDPVTVSWTLAARPAGSAATLSSGSGGSTGFVPDVAGQYRVGATASDGRGGTATDDVVVTAVEVVADAGPDQSVAAGATVALDGSGSRGANLTYAWRFVSTPGTAPALQGAGTANPTFVAPRAGEYLVELTVSNADGSDRDTVRVTAAAPNRAPTVSLTGPEAVFVGSTAPLTATASDPDGDPLTYSWTLVFAPPGSAATVDANGASAGVAVDLPGAYVVRVTVSDGSASAQAEVTVAGNVRVDGVYDATFAIGQATGCGDTPPDASASGELPVAQPTPTRVIFDLPGLDPLFGSPIEGRLEGTSFAFNGTVSIVGVDGDGNPVTISLASTIRGTMDGSSLDLSFQGSIFGCSFTGTLVGPKQ